MRFRTEINPVEPPFKINYHHQILMMGSCFTDNIGSRLKKHLFHTEINPFGVTFNPLSISTAIERLIEKEAYTMDDLGFYNELYFSFDHYTKFSDPNPDEVLNRINQRFIQAKQILKNADTLILTLGTAYTFLLRKNGRVVNNCHKLPASQFNRRLSSAEEIVSTLSVSLEKLFQLNSGLNIILTVSPVRHIKDGLEGNQISKSVLLLATKMMVEKFPEQSYYFPSYEIMMDDLRDYRYYENDLLHPNDQAIQYIWEQFSKTCFNPETQEIIQQITPLLKALNHKPQQENTEAYKKFETSTLKQKEKLKNLFPFLYWYGIK